MRLLRALSTPQRRWLRVGVLALSVLLAAQLASASALDLNGAKRAYVGAFSACSRNAISVTNATTGSSATTVTVSGLDASACSGKTIQLWLRDSAAGTLTATSATVSASTATITVPVYTPANVVGAIVYLGGWGAPTTWTYTPPTTLPAFTCEVLNGSNKTCTATVTSTTSWSEDWPTITTWIKTVQVSTTSSGSVKWQVTINLSSPDLPSFAKSLKDNQGGLVLVSTSGCSATPRTVTVKGTTSWGSYDTVTAGNPVSLQVQGSSMAGSTGNLLTCS